MKCRRPTTPTKPTCACPDVTSDTGRWFSLENQLMAKVSFEKIVMTMAVLRQSSPQVCDRRPTQDIKVHYRIGPGLLGKLATGLIFPSHSFLRYE